MIFLSFSLSSLSIYLSSLSISLLCRCCVYGRISRCMRLHSYAFWKRCVHHTHALTLTPAHSYCHIRSPAHSITLAHSVPVHITTLLHPQPCHITFAHLTVILTVALTLMLTLTLALMFTCIHAYTIYATTHIIFTGDAQRRKWKWKWKREWVQWKGKWKRKWV